MYSSPWNEESTESEDVIFGDPWSHLTPHFWYQNLHIAVQMAPGVLLGSVCFLSRDKEQCSVPPRLPKMGFTCREETMDGAWTVGLDVQSPVQNPLWWVVFWSRGQEKKGSRLGQGSGEWGHSSRCCQIWHLERVEKSKAEPDSPSYTKHTC